MQGTSFMTYIKETIMLTISHVCNDNFDGLMQDCSNSSALAMELLQSCTKASKCFMLNPSHAHPEIGNVAWWPLVEPLSQYPIILAKLPQLI